MGAPRAQWRALPQGPLPPQSREGGAPGSGRLRVRGGDACCVPWGLWRVVRGGEGLAPSPHTPPLEAPGLTQGPLPCPSLLPGALATLPGKPPCAPFGCVPARLFTGHSRTQGSACGKEAGPPGSHHCLCSAKCESRLPAKRGLSLPACWLTHAQPLQPSCHPALPFVLVTSPGACNSTGWGWHLRVTNKCLPVAGPHTQWVHKYRPVKKEVCTSEGRGRGRQLWAAEATCRVAGRVPFAVCVHVRVCVCMYVSVCVHVYECVCSTLIVCRSHTGCHSRRGPQNH